LTGSFLVDRGAVVAGQEDRLPSHEDGSPLRGAAGGQFGERGRQLGLQDPGQPEPAAGLVRADPAGQPELRRGGPALPLDRHPALGVGGGAGLGELHRHTHLRRGQRGFEFLEVSDPVDTLPSSTAGAIDVTWPTSIANSAVVIDSIYIE